MTAVDDPRIRPTDPDWLIANIDRLYAMRPLPDDLPRCRVPGCQRAGFALALCKAHWHQAVTTLDPVRSERHLANDRRSWAARRAAKAAKEAGR